MNYIQATLKVPSKNNYEVWIKLSGVSPFIKGKMVYIATAGFPISFSDNPTGINVEMNPEISNGVNAYDVEINPLEETQATATSPEKYYSVNISANRDIDQVFKKGKEYKVFSFSFNEEPPKEVALMNVSYRMHEGNFQAQLSIEDNHAREYTQPFNNKGDKNPFYSTKGQSKISYAGTGSGGESGEIPNTYVRYVKAI